MMPPYNQSQLLTRLEEQTVFFLEQAVQHWQVLPEQVLQHQSAIQSWSAAQCLQHLNSYGNYYIPAIRSSVEKASNSGEQIKDVFITGWLGNYFTRLMLPGADGVPVKKMKAPANHRPDAQPDAAAVVAEFIQQQEELLELLEKSKHLPLDKIRVPISISRLIRLKLGDVFCFLIAHNYRHLLQAERALNHAGINMASIRQHDWLPAKI